MQLEIKDIKDELAYALYLLARLAAAIEEVAEGGLDEKAITHMWDVVDEAYCECCIPFKKPTTENFDYEPIEQYVDKQEWMLNEVLERALEQKKENEEDE